MNENKQNIAIPLLAILISLLFGAIIILIIGKNPLSAYYSLLQGAGILPKPSYAGYKSVLTDLMSMLNALTPMIFAALAVAVAFKGGLFNIGVSGQMLCAGFFASVLVGYNQELSPYIAKPLVILIGIIAGGLVGALIGVLKHKYNINEVVSSIMINYILMYIISFFINTKFMDPVSRQSKYILQSGRLTLMDVQIGNLKMEIPLGIILALIFVFITKFLLDKTKIGYEIKAVGANKNAAMYAGINVSKNIIMTMFISGALAGLAGVCYYLGYFSSIRPKILPAVGFDAIAVSLLGNSNPIAIIFSSLLITIIGTGSTYMSSTAGISQEIASVITGVILLFSSCSAYFKYLLNKNKEKREVKSVIADEIIIKDKEEGDL